MNDNRRGRNYNNPRGNARGDESMLKTSNHSELILYCRKQVDDLCNEAIEKYTKYFSEINSRLTANKSCEVLKLRLNNLIQQQEEFDKTIAKLKGKLSSICVSDIHQDLHKSIDAILGEVQNECTLFERSLPAYAFKSTILNEVKYNQVTIFSSDSAYFLNILLPIVVKNEFTKKNVVCCETSNMLCARLKRNIYYLMYNKANMDEVEEKKLDNSIRFMVVEEILNLFSNNNAVDENNLFVILNLSLKRSVEVDIVLANLKDMLRNHNEARLVLLTSDCDHLEKYESYFSDQAKVARINMPNLTFPVKTVWKSQPTDDYIDEMVKTILDIHTLNDPGDIIAFLPTQSDVRSAKIGLTKKLSALLFKNFECVPLHENSTSKYGLDLFSKTKSSNRTIFLVTDCAEMLVISSVCFVIDCGLNKEYVFDINKKIDVLTTTLISRDKGKLRRSMAGAFSDGVCYRLYSGEFFCNEMPISESPEILSVNPFNSMIKVFQHRPRNATTADFVESLSEATEQNALKLLKKHKIIKNNVLTELLGKKIVKLPFSAKYSKFICLGINFGLAFEAVVLLAFFSVKGRVFEYSTDPESQKLIDAVKLQLIRSDSDTLSYLFIYKTWLENNSSLEWCNKHCINFETLKSVHSKVNEICQIVREALQINISQTHPSSEDNAMLLKELLFECFQENLCVFTGHYRSGYRMLSSNCIAFLHPSFIIREMKNLPQFIIFDQMLQTTRDFLITITAVPDVYVTDTLKNLSVEFDSFYSNAFEKSLVEKVIEPVSERTIKQVLLGKKGKKLRMIEDEIKKKLNTTLLVIDPMPERGRVLVYALEEQSEQAVRLVNEILKSQFEEIINLEQNKVLELKRGQIRVPVEVKWIKGATVVTIKTGSPVKTSATIQKNLDDEGENASDQPPSIISQCINLTWTRRRCNGKGFINLKGEDLMPARNLHMKCVPFLGSEVFVQLSKFPPYQLNISRIPPETKNCELKEVFSSLLRGITIEKVVLKYTDPFKTSENDIQQTKNILEEMCRKNTKLVNFNIVIPNPKDTATIMKAYINVSHDEDIAPVAYRLSEFTIGDSKFESKVVYSSVIKCRVEIYNALKERIEKRTRELQGELGTDFKFIYKVLDDMAAIKMLSNSREILPKLQRAVNVLLEGQVFNKMFNKELGKIFCHGGYMWLQTLEKSCNVHIVKDYVTKSLRLYGSEEGCYSASERIQKFLEDTENEVVKRFPLSVEGNNRKLLKAVIIEYGANLEKLIESCELRSANLDIKSCSLTVHGNRESIENVEDALKELAQVLYSSGFSKVLSNEEMCPVCVCPALNLTFRLELCGHLYCSECIKGLVDQAEFPLKCCADDCQKDIGLDDICKVLGDDGEKIKALLHKAMKAYVEGHQAEIFNCPSPDCPMFFYKKDLIGNKINCPLCENDICRQCNAIFHQGVTCDMYQGSKIDADYSLKVWQKSRLEVKNCPYCKIVIEKNGGCNHMTCRNCNSHICWQCMQLFPDSNSVYNHLPYCCMYGK